MNVHSKTRRRVQILIVTLLVLGIGGTAAYFVRKRQIAERILRDRDAGYAALEAGDHFNALHKIGPYLQRHPTEVDALVKYAKARRNVEEPNGRHLVDSISLYRRVLEQSPEHVEAREQLLDIYLSTGFNTEILTTTERRDDPPSLRARAIALSNLGRDAEARTTAERYLAARPDDLRMQMFYISQMQRAQVPGEQIVEYATKLAASAPNDPRMDLLTAFAYGVSENREQALKYTLKATAQPITDPEHVQIAVDMLDSLDREADALALLSRAADVGKDRQSQRRVIARLFQSRQFDLVNERVAKLSEADPKLDAELLAHRAMALQALGKHEDAEAVVAALAGRQNDFAASGWAGVLKVLPVAGKAPDDRTIIAACRDGLRGEADNPYFRLYLGDAYGRLGETDMATAEWARAAQGARVWAEPLERLLQLMIVTAQPETVRGAAARLKRLAPDDPDSLALVAAAEARLTDRSDPAAVSSLMASLDRVQQVQPGESTTLQLKVSLLALTGRAEDAKKLITDHLAPDRTFPAETYLALARASATNGLGLEQAAFDRCRAAHGASFDLAIAEAAFMAGAGRRAEALAAFEAARQGAPDRDQPAWRVPWAQLLEDAADPRAATAWGEVVDAFPDNAAVQRAAMASRTVQDNRDLQRRVIDRLKAVVGDSGLGWRMAEARWILAGVPSLTSDQDRQRELVRATALVNDMVQQYPDQYDVRILLADCLLRLEKRDEAITHLTAAVRLAPSAFAPAVQLAALLQSAGEFDQARPFLEQAERILERSATAVPAPAPGSGTDPTARPESTPPTAIDLSREAAWRIISSLYAQRGNTSRAVEILQRIDGTGERDTELAMAELLARRGELSDEACRKLMEKPTLAAIEVVAEQYARTGRTSDAEAALAKLDAVEAKEGERDLVRGLYHHRRLAFATAVPELQRATAALPDNEQGWRALLQSLILDGKGPEAVEAATRAAAAVPSNAAFRRLADNQQLIRDTAATPRLRPLLAALAESADEPEQLLAVLRLARDATTGGSTVAEVLSAVRPIADRSPRLAVVQYLLADMYQSMGNVDEALKIASRLMQLQPTDPQPAQRAAELLAATGRWREMIPVAQQWRARLGASTLPADEALAAAYVATAQYDLAMRQLEPYAAPAAAAPADWIRTLSLRARALIGLGRTADAEALLFPSLSTTPAARDAVIRISLSSLPDPAASARWLEQVTAATPADAIDERLVLAQAWQDLSSRPGQQGHRARVEAQLAEVTRVLSGKADARGETWVVLGMLKEQTGDLPGAEAAYRGALKADPNQRVAKNNLAMLLTRSSAGLPEALELATSAASDEQAPGHAEFLDTLAQVQSKAGKHDAAERSLRRAVALAPDNLPMRANLVQLLLDAGKPKEAKQALDELETLSASARQSNPQFDARMKALAASVAAALGSG